MPDCSKKSSEHSGESRNSRNNARPCLQTGAPCVDPEKLCCLTTAEIERRIKHNEQKMRQYSRELRDMVDEINREPGPKSSVLTTVLEMTDQYLRQSQDGLPNRVNGVPNGSRHRQAMPDKDLTAMISGVLSRFMDEAIAIEDRRHN